MRGEAPVIVGSGWIGSALAEAYGVRAASRRAFEPSDVPPGARMVIASGRAAISRREGLSRPLAEELAHLRAVLKAAEEANASRVVVLGSSDVAGMADEIDGTSPPTPQTVYGEVKAALEEECRAWRAGGLDVTCVRLAPVHGPGKRRTGQLIRLARMGLVPLPNGGRHSIGFVLLGDVIRATRWLVDHPTPAVQSVGAGTTPLASLLDALAAAQGRRLRVVPLPAVPAAGVLARVRSDSLNWALRLASPRTVHMDPPLEPTPLAEAARLLVSPC